MKLTLRSKFLILSALAQASVVGLLLWNSLRLMDNAVIKNADRVAHEYAVTLNLSLSPYAAAGRLAEIGNYLSEMLQDPRDSFVRYIVIEDADGKALLAVGAAAPPGAALFHGAGTRRLDSLQTELTGTLLHARVPLLLKDNRVGALRFGISTDDLALARSDVLTQGSAISVAGFLLGLLLFYLFTHGIGRRLDILHGHSRRLAQGDLTTLLPEQGGDELEAFSRSLNTMSCALAERIGQLELAQARLRDSEGQLKELNVSLESRVKLRAAELELTNTELSQTLATLQRTQADLIAAEKMASLGSLVAGIAHELGTPIGNSLLAATALSDRVGEFQQHVTGGTLKRSTLEKQLADMTHACMLIARSLARADQLITSFKQVAVDQTNDERREFDLRALIEDTLTTFGPRMRRAKCSSTLELDGALRMHSYPGSLCQVLSNLISNALVHATEGRAALHITIAARACEGGEVELVFDDDGAGMGEDVVRRVFDPFFTTKLGQGGSGLGMNIVYNIVTGVLGGRIDVRTGLGEGTTITMTLPGDAPRRTAATAQAAGKSGVTFDAIS
ncbi:MAG: ATP-binding protein [Pseudomonadota bacterium]